MEDSWNYWKSWNGWRKYISYLLVFILLLALAIELLSKVGVTIPWYVAGIFGFLFGMFYRGFEHMLPWFSDKTEDVQG